MGEANFMRKGNLVSAANAVTGCRPLTDAVECEDRGLVEWRREKGARGVRLVMIGEYVPAGVTGREVRG